MQSYGLQLRKFSPSKLLDCFQRQNVLIRQLARIPKIMAAPLENQNMKQ